MYSHEATGHASSPTRVKSRSRESSRRGDRAQLALLHENLRSADWPTWAAATRRGALAIADYKGRVVYSSAAPTRFGESVRGLPAVAVAYDPTVAAGAMVLGGGDGAGGAPDVDFRGS